MSTTRKEEYTDLLHDAKNLKNEIIKLTQSGGFDDFVTIDVPLLLKNYLTQTEQLLWRFNKLCSVIDEFSIESLNKTIAELTEMRDKTDNALLKEKCDISISQYENNKITVNNYQIQKNKIKDRLDNTIFSLLKIKYDLQKLSGMDSNRHRLEFYKNFKDSFNLEL